MICSSICDTGGVHYSRHPANSLLKVTIELTEMDLILALVDCYQQHRQHAGYTAKNRPVSLYSPSPPSSVLFRKAKVSPKRKKRPSSEAYLTESEAGTPTSDIITPKL